MFRSGAACDPSGRAGLASIAAEMLDEGAGARDALGIAAELEQLGADLWLGSGRDGSQLSMQAPRETFHAAMAIAADVLIRPRLEQADWQRVHNDRRTGVVQRRDQPEAVVNVVVGSDPVRRRPSLRPAGRRAGTDDRRDHARRRARVPRRPLPPGQRLAGRRRRHRRGDAAVAAGGAAGGVEARRPRRRRRARCPGRRGPAWSSSIAPARPRASCGWSRPAPIVFRPIGPGCRC